MQNRRSSFSSSTTSSLAKRNPVAASSENGGKKMAPGVHPTTAANSARKRAPLGEITNTRRFYAAAAGKASKTALPSSSASSSLVQSSTKNAKLKRGLPSVNSSEISASKITSTRSNEDAVVARTVNVVPSCDLDELSKSDGVSMSLDETMSTCDSSPEVDSENEKTTLDRLSASDHVEVTENVCTRDELGVADMDTDEKVVNLDMDMDMEDPQLCVTIACDIYNHLRASEMKKRPSTDFMEKIQKDINASMRAILIDWLVEVAEEYRLVPDTLYLTVNYIDRYLSGNVINRQRLQLLGVSCMMIAAKYEEICTPQVEEFCYITDNTYFKEELLEMESTVLNYLKFEMTAPTAKCFLRRFVRAAQLLDGVPSMQLECLANYITELSLLEYNMLRHAPSVVAASAIFLAKFILFPSKRPWNSTLQHYTLYQPSDLLDCIKDLHRLCCDNYNSTLPAIREKYSTHKYKFVAKKFCPPQIPEGYFQKQS